MKKRGFRYDESIVGLLGRPTKQSSPSSRGHVTTPAILFSAYYTASFISV